MVMSKLARKVFDQTTLPVTPMNAFWVECRLQMMAINGLAQMITKSKKKEPDYIDGYMPMYKWSFRKEYCDIRNCGWVFDLIQCMSSDFTWDLWQQISTMDFSRDYNILKEAIAKTIATEKIDTNQLNYALAIYTAEKEKLQQFVQLQKVELPSTTKKQTPSQSMKMAWEQQKKLLYGDT